MDAPAHQPSLIINDGSVGGLVATWTALWESRSRADAQLRDVVWIPPGRDDNAVARREAVDRQYELCALAAMSDQLAFRFDASDEQLAGSESVNAAGLQETAMLLSAASEALSFGIRRVVWPVQGPLASGNAPDLDRLAEITDRVTTVSELISIDALGGGISIDVPFADLTDEQLVELAIDLDAPLDACWWCLQEPDSAARPCGTCDECARWSRAIKAVDPAGIVAARQMVRVRSDTVAGALSTAG